MRPVFSLSRVFLGGVLLLSLGVAVGCSGNDSQDDFVPNEGQTPPGSGGDAGASASGGQGGNGQAGSGGATAGAGGQELDAGTGGDGGKDSSVEDVVDASDPDVNFGYDAHQKDSSLTPDSACAISKIEAQLTPLDIYVMLDRSGSMVEPGYHWSLNPNGPGIVIDGGDCNYSAAGTPINSKWCYSVYALAGYFDSNPASDMRAALQFFPEDGYNCDSSAGNSLTTPAVSLTSLATGASQLIQALNAADPLGSRTPTKAALHGIAGFTGAHKQNGRIIIGLLITDGKPNSCAPNDGSSVGKVAADHFSATGIPTYVVGMNGISDYSTLEQIASKAGAPSHSNYCAGGIQPCHFYDVGNGDPTVFKNVLHKIQKNAIGCSYALPSTNNGIVDPDLVSVEYTPGNGGAAVPIKKVASQAACGNSDAFYYDNNTPPNIILCPSTCSTVQADDLAKVTILVGCEGS